MKKGVPMWNTYVSPIKIAGTPVVGTAGGPRTAWWSLPLLRLFWWTDVAVLRLPTESAQQGYRIGYRSEDGREFVWSELCYNDQVRMQISREFCTFFAVDLCGLREIPLTIVMRATKNDPRFKHARLYKRSLR